MLRAVDPRPLLRARLLSLTAKQRRVVLEAMGPDEQRALRYDWQFWRRPSQAPPVGLWRYWLILAGRGYGKTKCGAEWVRDEVASGRARMIGLVGRTSADVRDTMILGPAGIMAVTPEEERPTWIPARRTLEWPNGAIAHVFSSEEPDQLRGPERDLIWADELAAFYNLGSVKENIDFVLRATGPLGDPARAMFTTTPRPKKEIKDLVKDPMCVVTRGSTFENSANLDPTFLAKLRLAYEGTRTGRQELYAEILEDFEGALWTMARLERCRVRAFPRLLRVLVAVDPAVTSGEDSDEHGIVVVGLGIDDHIYVLEDASLRGTPGEWGRRVVEVFRKWDADIVVAEVNNGGEMVMGTIHTIDDSVPVSMVRASRGKRTRAEPVSALYEKEQPRIHHVGADLVKLEKQLCEWSATEKEASPDRLDALVWGVTKLAFENIDNVHVGYA